MKKLYRSDKDKVLAGILGGVGEYLEIDPTILRLIYIVFAVMTGIIPAAIGYFIAYLIVPDRPAVHATEAKYTETPKETPKTEPVKEETKEEVKEEDEPKTEGMI